MKAPAPERVHLVLSKSFEERSLSVLRSLVAERRVARVTTIHYLEYDAPLDAGASELDVIARSEYARHSSECDQLLATAGVDHRKLQVQIDSARLLLDGLRDVMADELDLVLDISCLPRMHLSAILWRLLAERPASAHLAYTRVREHKPDESLFSIGVKGFAGVPGLGGEVRHRGSAAVFALGFEGNRAYAAYRHISPDVAVALVGLPNDIGNKYYEETVVANNHYLLKRERVRASTVTSLQPVKFARELDGIVRSIADGSNMNVYWVCLGTKLQTVGGVLATLANPFVQHLFPLPAHRRISSAGIGQTEFFHVMALRDAFLASEPPVV